MSAPTYPGPKNLRNALSALRVTRDAAFEAGEAVLELNVPAEYGTFEVPSPS